jgi:hypothetical protein
MIVLWEQVVHFQLTLKLLSSIICHMYLSWEQGDTIAAITWTTLTK